MHENVLPNPQKCSFFQGHPYHNAMNLNFIALSCTKKHTLNAALTLLNSYLLSVEVFFSQRILREK